MKRDKIKLLTGWIEETYNSSTIIQKVRQNGQLNHPQTNNHQIVRNIPQQTFDGAVTALFAFSGSALQNERNPIGAPPDCTAAVRHTDPTHAKIERTGDSKPRVHACKKGTYVAH